MRVAMVSPYDLAVPGGVQGQVMGLAAALDTLGVQVTVVAPGTPIGRRRDGSIGVGRSVGVRANGSVAPVSLSPSAALRAVRAVQTSSVDLIHLHEPLAPVVNYGFLLTAGHPMVGTLHRNGASSLYRVLAPAARWALGRLAACCAVSEAARDNVGGLVRGDVTVLFNGVDVERFGAAAPSPTDAPTVLFVGRHERRKGLAVLLEAFGGLPPPAVLWIAGTGPETAELRRRYPPSDRVCWLGAISEEEKMARMAGADVLCAPSLGGESFGVVLLEGMAACLTVVASDIDGYRTAAGGHARLVTPGDPGALATALAEGLREAGTNSGRSSPDVLGAARRHAERWSMRSLAEHYLAIYEQVAGGRSGGTGSGQ